MVRFLISAGFLGSSLGIEALESHPTLLRAPQDSVMQLHVDDILGSTTRTFAHETSKPTMESKYKIKFEVLSEPGDVIWFLKRKLRLISADQLLVTPRPKYVERLGDFLKVNGACVRAISSSASSISLETSASLLTAASNCFLMSSDLACSLTFLARRPLCLFVVLRVPTELLCWGILRFFWRGNPSLP